MTATLVRPPAGTSREIQVHDGNGQFSAATDVVIDASGNIGIGTSTPGQTLDVAGTLDVSGHSAFGLDGVIDTFNTGLYGYLSIPGQAGLLFEETITDLSGARLGMRSSLDLNPSVAPTSSAFAHLVDLAIASGNAENFPGNQVALELRATHIGTGIATAMFGMTCSTTLLSAGNITSGFGGKFSVTNGSTGTITNAYGIRIDDIDNPSGTITNAYGIYIEHQADVTNTPNTWSLYVEGPGQSYFGDSVGIGNTTPAGILDLTSTTSAMILTRMTTAQRDAISTPVAGMILYNTSTNVVDFYNGSSWGAV